MDIVQLYGEIIQVYHSMGKYRISIPVVEEFIEFANIGVPVFGKLFKINTMASYAELDDFDKAKEILLSQMRASRVNVFLEASSFE